MFRGSAPAKIDEKGRLKIPTGFRRLLQERYGRELFVTSVQGDSVLAYPLKVWEGIEAKLAAMPSTDRTKRRYLERVSYFGHGGIGAPIYPVGYSPAAAFGPFIPAFVLISTPNAQ